MPQIVNPGGGTAPATMDPLPDDSRLYDDPPADWPLGQSIMRAHGTDTGTFGDMYGNGTIWMNRPAETEASSEPSTQLLMRSGTWEYRWYIPNLTQWSPFVALEITDHNHDALYYRKADIDALEARIEALENA